MLLSSKTAGLMVHGETLGRFGFGKMSSTSYPGIFRHNSFGPYRLTGFRFVVREPGSDHLRHKSRAKDSNLPVHHFSNDFVFEDNVKFFHREQRQFHAAKFFKVARGDFYNFTAQKMPSFFRQLHLSSLTMQRMCKLWTIVM